MALTFHRSKPKQAGLALALALFLLLLISLIATAGVRESLLELRLSLNDEIYVSALQRSQSLLDRVLDEPSNLTPLADGTLRCLNDAFNERFDGQCPGLRPLTVDPQPGDADATDAANVVITRQFATTRPPPIGTGFSADHFSAAQLKVTAIFDGSASGRGRSEVHEGVALVFNAEQNAVVVAE